MTADSVRPMGNRISFRSSHKAEFIEHQTPIGVAADHASSRESCHPLLTGGVSNGDDKSVCMVGFI